MTIMNQFLTGIVTVISDYYKRQTKKDLAFDATSCTREELVSVIIAMTTQLKREDRKKALIYLVDNFISLREQIAKIDPNSTDTSLSENLASFVISLQILLKSTEDKTTITANGFELTDEGLSISGYRSTSLRFSGQRIVSNLFMPFGLDYEKSTCSEVKLWAQSVSEEYVKDRAKHVKTQSFAEQIAALQASNDALQKTADSLAKRVTGLEVSNRHLEDAISALQQNKDATPRTTYAGLVKHSMLGGYGKKSGPLDAPLFPSGFPGFSSDNR